LTTLGDGILRVNDAQTFRRTVHFDLVPTINVVLIEIIAVAADDE
jgi:hypothetical protein